MLLVDRYWWYLEEDERDAHIANLSNYVAEEVAQEVVHYQVDSETCDLFR